MTKELAIFGADEPDDLVRLRLVPAGSTGGIRLVAVDKDGVLVHRGNLLKITSNGVYFNSGVNQELGFKLYGDGRLREVA